MGSPHSDLDPPPQLRVSAGCRSWSPDPSDHQSLVAIDLAPIGLNLWPHPTNQLADGMVMDHHLANGRDRRCHLDRSNRVVRDRRCAAASGTARDALVSRISAAPARPYSSVATRRSRTVANPTWWALFQTGSRPAGWRAWCWPGSTRDRQGPTSWRGLWIYFSLTPQCRPSTYSRWRPCKFAIFKSTIRSYGC